MAKAKEKKVTKKRLTGVVNNLSSEKTIKVNVERRFPHPKYDKIVKVNKAYLVHCPDGCEEVELGDEVVIEEMKPVSKRKTWKFIEIVKKNK